MQPQELSQFFLSSTQMRFGGKMARITELPMAAFEERYAKLNKEQKEAVDTLAGPVMVIAGRGRGRRSFSRPARGEYFAQRS